MHRLLAVRQEQVGERQQLAQASIPALRRIPVGVDRRGGARGAGRTEELGQTGRQRGLEEEGRHVDVPSGADVHRVRGQARDRAAVGEHRAVAPGLREHDGQPGAPLAIHHHAARVHAALPQRVHHEAPEQVVAHHARDPGPQAQPRCAARHYRARAADEQIGVAHQLLHLPERGLDALAAQHQVGVDVPEDQEVEVRGRHVGNLLMGPPPERPGNPRET